MNKHEHAIAIFTDGSSRGNPGPGGWAAVIVAGGSVIELGGAEKETTNNRMEITAAVRALEHTKAGHQIELHTDSSYLINGITKWIAGWKRNGWKTKTKADVLNRDLWEELHEFVQDRSVKWIYVGGHIGVLGNERCDHIATAFADGRPPKLYSGPLSAYDLPDVLDVSHDQERMKSKKSDSARARGKAYSYVSMVNGLVETHKTWAECEARVKGTKGARYKKAMDPVEEMEIIGEFKPEANF